VLGIAEIVPGEQGKVGKRHAETPSKVRERCR
jgi:hypothetical protein